MEIVEVVLLGFIAFQCWFNYKTDQRMGLLYDMLVQDILKVVVRNELDTRTNGERDCKE